MAGTFITFEGGDGAGKSTHIRFLAEILEDLGLDVVQIREPGGTPIGEKLRRVLLDKKNTGLSDRAELLVYEASRAQLIDDVIIPALDRGAVVLCDRFTDSTVAYQGYGRGLDIDFIRRANDFATDGITPDVTIVLACADRAEKRDRVDRRKSMDRLELAGDDFHARVIDSFSELASEGEGRMHLIDTGGRHSETALAIFKALASVFPQLTDGTVDLTSKLEAYDARHDHSGDAHG